MHETTFLLRYASEKRATLVESAIAPEVGDIADDRTSVELERSGTALEITIRATDPVALRAGQNTWLGLVAVAESVETTPDLTRTEDCA